MSRIKVLIADDNENVLEILRMYLQENQMDVIEAPNGKEALTLAAAEKPDVILLDIMMPETDGLDVCREIRKASDVPIIMISAKDGEFDRILGLELGADDYVTKPFSPREIVARIKAILRRSSAQTESAATDAQAEDDEHTRSTDKITTGEITIILSSREVFVKDESLFFRPKEFDLLVYMIQHPNKVLTRDELLQQVWEYEFVGDVRTVDVHVKKIREKLHAHEIDCIHTVWGVGYRFQLASNKEVK